MNSTNDLSLEDNHNEKHIQSEDKKVKRTVIKRKEVDHTFKIVLIGDSGVGKSCILLRFADDKFNENFFATIGVDFRFKNVALDGKNIKLQIWDTAGQERFKTITSAYYRGAEGIVIVYDVTDRNSFAHVKDWLEEVSKYSVDNPVKIVLGNKCDQEEKKEVFQEDINALSRQYGVEVFEVSAKEAIKVSEVMEMMTRKLIEKSIRSNEPNKEIKQSKRLSNKPQEIIQQKCC